MDHYFTNNNLESELFLIRSMINGHEYEFYSDNGVFSKKNIDYGTKLLLENIKDVFGNVLDLGCGYGVIGIYINMNYNTTVDMVDINLRAIKLSKMNIKKYKLTNINAYESDAYKNIINKYDFIITNPPIRAGKNKILEILIGAKEYMKESSKLYFVMRKDQGVGSIINILKDHYKITILKKSKGFWVVCAEN